MNSTIVDEGKFLCIELFQLTGREDRIRTEYDHFTDVRLGP